MNSNKVIVFDIFGEYGHFRKINTTSSPLTYSIPTRTAIIGLIGAILGIEREVKAGMYPKGVVALNELFGAEQASIGVQIMAPIKKTNIGFNLVNTAKSFFNIENRTQVEFELLKDCEFRIFLLLSDDKYHKELEQRLKAVDHHFTPYLGLSQFTASVDYKETLSGSWKKLKKLEKVEVGTAVSLSSLDKGHSIDFTGKEDFHYITETIPRTLDKDRKATYVEILVEISGKKERKVCLETDKYFELEDGQIITFL